MKTFQTFVVIVVLASVCLAHQPIRRPIPRVFSPVSNLISLKNQLQACTGQFYCTTITTGNTCTTECINKTKICDGTRDCSNGLDENCSGTSQNTRCQPGQYACLTNNACINASQVCNNMPDCPGMDDERFCPQQCKCAAGNFRCNSAMVCLPGTSVCNGVSNCPMGEDETSCPATCNCPASSFVCQDRNQCIPVSQYCDGTTHCSDSSDEPGRCACTFPDAAVACADPADLDDDDLLFINGIWADNDRQRCMQRCRMDPQCVAIILDAGVFGLNLGCLTSRMPLASFASPFAPGCSPGQASFWPITCA